MNNPYLQGVITIPSNLLITNITQSNPMVVSVAVGNATTAANTYIAGMAVRLFVPRAYGMNQADGLIGTITGVSGNDLILDLDSSLFDAFVSSPPVKATQPASISPAGSRNYEYSNSSSNVPFQSLNNLGN